MDSKTFNPTEIELNELFKETLDGLRDDLTEANENVQLYYTALNTDKGGGKDVYGNAYNDALKIKGSTRDRFLKFVALIKERVTKKEDNAVRIKGEEGGDGMSISHKDLNEFLGTMKSNLNKDDEQVPKIDFEMEEDPDETDEDEYEMLNENEDLDEQ